MSPRWYQQSESARRWLSLLIVACFLSLAAYFAGQALRVEMTGPASRNQSMRSMPVGWELQIIFVSSSSCIGNTVEGFAKAVREAKQLLAQRSDSLGIAFSTVGVAKDWNIETGYRYLTEQEWSGPQTPEFDLEFGRWDEISVGRNWGNTIISHYVENRGGTCRREAETRLLVPQLLVARRFARDWRTDAHFAFSQQEVLFRLCGAHRSIEWVGEGAKVPNLNDMAVENAAFE